MKEAPLFVMEESWDCLIVLDACRYDYFEQLWRHYLPGGRLECRRSPGSCTDEWRKRSFPGYYEDVVYVSSNPYINSQSSVAGFRGGEHFYRVVDVWQFGWEANRGTVLPETVTQEALRALHQYPGKRFIIHYLQPHAPYLSFGSECAGFPRPDVEKEDVLRGTVLGRPSGGIRRKIYRKMYHWLKHTRFLGNHPDWMLAEILRLPPLSPMDAVRRKYGCEGLRRAYRENLEIVLRQVGTLIDYLKGRIVITSDHGELLGERRSYSHGLDSDDPVLRTVPWWTTYTEACREIPPLPELPGRPVLEEDVIQKRLKDLGYL